MKFVELSNQGLERLFDITIGADYIEDKADQELSAIAPNVSIPGFRKGKVPLSTVKTRFKKSIVADIVNKEIDSSVKQIIEDNKFNIASRPIIKDVKHEEGKDVLIKVQFELMPVIDEPNFQDIKLLYPKVKITEEDIQKEIETMSRALGSFSALEDGAQAKLGDRLLIDFEGSIGGEKFAGGTAKGASVILGSKSFIDNFEDQLVGHKVGDEVKVKVKFPKEYHSSELAGKKAEFLVQIHSIESLTPMAIDDESVKRLGVNNVSELKQNIEKRLVEAFDSKIYLSLKRKLFDELEKMLKFELPKSILDNEYNNLLASHGSGVVGEGPEQMSQEKFEQHCKRIAERRVRIGMMLSLYGKNHDISVSNSDIESYVREMLSRASQAEGANIRNSLANPNFVQYLRESAFEDKVVRYIIAHGIIVTEKLYSADEMKKLLIQEEEEDIL